MIPEPLKIEVELNNDAIDKIAKRVIQISEGTKDVSKPVLVQKVFSVNEVAKIIPSLSPDTIRRYCKNGILEASKTGKSYLIPQESLDKYLTKNA